MRKTLLDELNECISPLTPQETLCDMVDLNYFCEKFYGDIGDFLEENYPDDIINRAERIEREREKERYANMSKKELKADEDEFKVNAKYGRE